MTHHTGNEKRRPPMVPVTRAMAQAGCAKLDALTSVDSDGSPITDNQLVAEVFLAMWACYWEQVFAVQGKNLKSPLNLILPPSGLIRQ